MDELALNILDIACGVEGHMGRDDNVGKCVEHRAVAMRQDIAGFIEIVETRFVFDCIERRTAQMARFERIDERGGIDEHAARCVDENGSVGHERELLLG